MTTYILRRILLMIPTLIGVTAVVFFVMALAPGGFGGTVLNQFGAQTEGDEARRIREYFDRRYGLDKPPVIQYGRWLNQVSPIGFRSSGKTTFTDAQIAEGQTILDQSDMLRQLNQPRAATETLRSLAAYMDVSPREAADMLLTLVDDVEAGLAMTVRIADRKVSEMDARRRQAIRDTAREKPIEAKAMLLRELNHELVGRDRILFGLPVVKMPDLGTSLRGRPVLALLSEAVPITILLNAMTIPIIYIVALATGIFAARHRGKLIDVGSGFVMLALWSLPVMGVGVLLIGYLANKQFLKLFPTGGLHDLQAASMAFLPTFTDAGFQRGWLLDFLWHLVLPMICFTYGGFAVLAKLTRSSVLDNIRSDYVRTARAKGVDEHTVLFRHVFRNSLLPLIAIFAGLVPSLFVGSVVVESIFSIPGMGKLGVEAAFMKDREVIMGTTLIGGILGLLSQILRDVAYAIADPRVSYE